MHGKEISLLAFLIVVNGMCVPQTFETYFYANRTALYLFFPVKPGARSWRVFTSDNNAQCTPSL